MKFLVDAQLPKVLAIRLREFGHECFHTSDLPEGNFSSDQTIGKWADAHGCIVISKDADFVSSHTINGVPAQLLIISTGNISNFKLLRLFENNIELITSALTRARFVELSPTRLIVHD